MSISKFDGYEMLSFIQLLRKLDDSEIKVEAADGRTLNANTAALTVM